MMEEQKNKQPVQADIEGDRWTWWYVCGECHGAIDPGEKICHHCKTEISRAGVSWDGC